MERTRSDKEIDEEVVMVFEIIFWLLAIMGIANLSYNLDKSPFK